MQMKPKQTGKSRKILLGLLVGLATLLALSPILIFVGLFGYMIWITDQEYASVKEDVPAFYQEAGFKGEIISIDSEAHGFSTQYPYTYREVIDGENQDFTMRSHGAWDEDVKGEKYDSLEELAANFSDRQIEPFFNFAFRETEEFREFEQAVNHTLTQQGLEVTSFTLDLPTFSESEGGDFTKALLEDLQKAELEGHRELRGIRKLSIRKYQSLGEWSFHIIVKETDKTLDLESLDVSTFIKGVYRVDKQVQKEVADSSYSSYEYLTQFTVE